MAAMVLKARSVRYAPAVARLAQEESRWATERDDAYQKGLAAGRRAAEAAGVAAAPRVAAALEAAVERIEESLASRATGDAATLVGCATEIASWILARELATDPTAVLARIEAALDGLAPTGRMVVRVAPELVELVGEWAAGRDAEVVGDPTLEPGEARLDAGDAGADLTWQQAFARVRDAFDVGDTPNPGPAVGDTPNPGPAVGDTPNPGLIFGDEV